MICLLEHASLVLQQARPHYCRRPSMNKICVSLLLIMFVFVIEPAPALARTNNVDSTLAYIRADYALVRAMKRSLSTVRAGAANLVHEVTHNCPNAAVGSPNNAGAIELGVEALNAVGIVMSSLHRTAMSRFFHTVITLRWSNPEITHFARAYAAKLRKEAKLILPPFCGNVREWAAGGFQKLSTGTREFNHRVNIANVGPKEVPYRLLAPFIDNSAERATWRHTKEWAVEIEAAELKIGLQAWTRIVDAVGLHT
jgi:hypothetical protein